MQTNTSFVNVSGGLTLKGAVLHLGNAGGTTVGEVFFTGTASQTIDGTSANSGTVLFGGNSGNELSSSGGSVVTYGPHLTVTGADGEVNAFGAAFDIQGTVTADPTANSLGLTSGSITLNATNWTNDGAIQARNGGSLDLMGISSAANPAWTNSVGHTISISGSGSLTLEGGGPPTPDANGTEWLNNGTIADNASTVNLGGIFTLAALGTFNRTGGTVNLTGSLNNTGSTLLLTNATGSWNLLGGTVNGGSVAAQGTNALVGTGNGGTLIGVTLDGTGSGSNVSPLDMQTNSSIIDVSGGLTLKGAVLRLGDPSGNNTSSQVFFTGVSPQTMDGAPSNPGTVLFGNNSSNSLSSFGSVVTFGANLTVTGAAGQINTSLAAFDIEGTVAADPAAMGLGQTSGTITLNGTNWTNNGTILAQNGGIIQAQGTVSNFSSGTLTGGAWEVFTNSSLELIGGNITTNSATIVLDGSNSNFFSDAGFTDALAGLNTNAAASSFTIRNGRNFSPPAGGFSNAGAVIVGSGSDFLLGAGDNYTQTGGDTSVSGTLDSAAGTSNLLLQGGQLDGNGTIALTAVNNSGGQVNPGVQVPPSPATPGTLTITGDYAQTSGGTLNIRLGGTATGTFDQLAVSGNVQLGGTVAATLVNGFAPSNGNAFQVLTFAGNTPPTDFSTRSFPSLSGLIMEEQLDTADVTLLIALPVTLTPSLPADTINIGYNQTISASGGTGSKSLVVSNIQNAIPGLNVPSSGTDSLAITGTPTATGTETFTVTATDALGQGTATVNYSITVNPALSIAPDTLPQGVATINYDHTITVSGGTTPYATFAVNNFSAGTTGLTASDITTDAAAGTVTVNGTPTAAGTATFTVNVTDSVGATLTKDYTITVTSFAVDTPNVSPTSTNEGSSTSFSISGTFSDTLSPNQAPYTAVINWGDNTTDTATISGSANPFNYSFNGNHTYADSGSYNVTVTVTDKDNNTATSPATTVTVADVVPTVSTPTVSPTSTNEGSSTSFSVSGTFTDPANTLDEPYTAVINWGDNTTDTATVSGSANPFSYSFSGTHTYADAGSYNVTVSVTDTDGGTGTSSATVVTVANVAPTVSTATVSPTSANEGAGTSFNVSGTFTDPAGALDQPYTAVINWGDNTTDTATVSGSANPFSYSFNGNHTYADAGSYNVTVSVTDTDGGTGTSAATTVTVANVAPTVSTPTVSPTSANEGTSTSFSVSGTFTDPANTLDEPYTAVINWGDNTTDTATVSGSANPFSYSFYGNHTFAVAG
jgi:hypothetical protein